LLLSSPQPDLALNESCNSRIVVSSQVKIKKSIFFFDLPCVALCSIPTHSIQREVLESLIARYSLHLSCRLIRQIHLNKQELDATDIFFALHSADHRSDAQNRESLVIAAQMHQLVCASWSRASQLLSITSVLLNYYSFSSGSVSTLLSADFSSAISTSTLLPDHEHQASGNFTHRDCIGFDRELPDQAISP
jgi:hypothetical protein